MFALDPQACPIILVSRLAEHSRNLASDPRCSLLVRRPRDTDPQADGRLTLMAEAAPLEANPMLRARFQRLVPHASRLLQLGDFHFMRLHISHLRYIGGFGAAHWLNAAQFVPPNSDIAQAEGALLESLSRNGGDMLRALCQAQLGRAPVDVQPIGVDCDGIDLLAEKTRLRVDFPRPVAQAAEIPGVVESLAAGGTEKGKA